MKYWFTINHTIKIKYSIPFRLNKILTEVELGRIHIKGILYN